MMVLLSKYTRKTSSVLKSVLEQEYSLEVPGSAALSKSSWCFLIGKRMGFFELRG